MFIQIQNITVIEKNLLHYPYKEVLMMKKELTSDSIQYFKKQLNQQPAKEIVAHAVMNQGINAVSENPKAKVDLNRVFSIDLPTGKVTAQEKSGRCWLFATLNTLRHEFANQYHVKDFEFSQNYLSFWDRVEKANSFFEMIIETADLPTNDRRVNSLLKMPDDDGGQWANAAALIQKYGLVPKYAMPETQPSNHTNEFSQVLGKQLRKGAMVLRQLHQEGAPHDELEEKKEELMAIIYRMCTYSFGEPVEHFDFEYYDDDNHYHCERDLTPLTFRDRYVTRVLDDYVVLCNAPDRPFYKRYALYDEDNIQGGRHVEFINAPLDIFKQLLIQQLKDGETTWFGCDVLQQMNRQEGFLDSQLYCHDKLFNTDLSFSKEERLQYFEAVCSHAMTFTGVDLIDEQPIRWKVENSWGDKIGDKGYFVMSDSWFDDYVYEVVINKKYLPDSLKQALETEPVRIELWDALA